ncbi:MAG: ribosome silencing factor [Parachlamydiales bacterium]|nr:ribosome silencing factor [Parachlamydiales bacterium]
MSHPELNTIAQALFDKKGFNILALDVRPLSTLTDYVIIAEGSVDRHVVALANYVVEIMREKGVTPVHVEGTQMGDWVVIDYLDTMVHLFMPGTRERYRLEELWQTAEIVNLDIRVDEPSVTPSNR